MRPHYDVVVIGAGPAGSVAAHSVARRGLSVLLLDRARFPRDKVCGCCLNARGRAALRRAGLGLALAEAGEKSLRRLSIHAAGRSASLALEGSVRVSRRRLDAALVDYATRAGVKFVDDVAATLGSATPMARRVHLRMANGTRDRVHAGAVVIADGLAGTALRDHPEYAADVRPRSRIGAGVIVDLPTSEYQSGVVFLAGSRQGYLGVVRLEDGRLDVAAAFDRQALRGSSGPGTLAALILAETGLPGIPGLVQAAWRGTPALTRCRPCFAGERFFVVGDAAGYVEPFTGEGIAWAVESAVEVSRWIPQPDRDWPPTLATNWTRTQRTIARRRQWACRAVAGLWRRPALAREVVRLIGHSPRLAAPLVRHLTQPSAG